MTQKKKDQKTPVDAATQARFDEGHVVGDLAKQLFPGGKEVVFNSKDYAGMVNTIKELIDSGCTTIYEATFKEDNVFVMADILYKGVNGWEFYEVKSSTSVKDYHRNDTAIQWYVLDKAGIELSRACIVHIDNSYSRGEDLEIDKLFTIADITEGTLALQNSIPEVLKEAEAVLNGGEPDILIGTHCEKPHKCDYSDYCWKDVPENSVLELYGIKKNKSFELFHNGIRSFGDLTSDTKLNHIQQLQIRAHGSDTPIINKDVINEFLESIVEPISYFDFETFQNAIPRFKGQKPCQQIPFQYSLHIQTKEGIEHKEFLGNENEDPRRKLAEQMIADFPTSGCIVAFNMSFEKRVIKELADQFPDLAEGLLEFNERFVDLVVPFRKGGYYNRKMKGSFSLKSVLPALFPDDPELSYKGLTIQDGGAASSIFANLHSVNNPSEVAQIRDDLLAYCKLDTLAMVKIVGLLRGVVSAQFFI
jgi:hypothetical protein